MKDRFAFLESPHGFRLSTQDARRKAKSQAMETIIDWLDMANFNRQYNAHQQYEKQLSLCLDGTCKWIFDKPEYLDWASDDPGDEASRLLWVWGPPGHGKSVLCAKIVERFKSEHKGPVGVFFSSTHAASASVDDINFIIRAWMTQIASAESQILNLILGYSERSDVGNRGSETEIWSAFETILAQNRGIALFLDGFDEYPRTRNARDGFLRRLKTVAAGTTTKIFITSREESDIKAELWPDSIQIPGQFISNFRITRGDVDQDLTLYSRTIVDQSLPNKDESFRERLSTLLTQKCEGMFLWIKLQQLQQSRGKNMKRLERIVQDMPQGLTETYRKNWETIRHRSTEDQIRALTVLRWTKFALRPLTISEISEALVIDAHANGDSLPLEELPDEIDNDYINGEIIDLCGSLIEVREGNTQDQPGSRTIHLVHPSVGEFLLLVLPKYQEIITHEPTGREHAANPADHHRNLADACLAYLNYDNIWSGSENDQSCVSARSFLDYAARFWHIHHQNAMMDDYSTSEIVSDFFLTGSASFNQWAKYFECCQKSTGDGELPGTPLYYATLFDFHTIMESIWTKDKLQIDVLGGRCGTPLQAACTKNNSQAFERLLRWGADVNIEGGEFGTALGAAAAGGFKEMVRVLIESGAKLELRDSMDRTPIFSAAKNGFTDIVDVLVTSGAGINTTHHSGWTPVAVATYAGHLKVVQLLLDNGVDANASNSGGWTPINSAAHQGHLEVVRLLLENGVDANTSNNDGWTPIKSAASENHLEVVRLLLDKGVDANTSSTEGWAPINSAASRGHLEMIRLLLDNGVDANTSNTRRWTPINSAAQNGHLKVVQLLLDNGVDANTSNNEGWTPINSAAQKGHLEVVRLLLENGVDANTSNNDGWTPIKSAASENHLEVVRLLLDKGVDANTSSTEGWAPINSAASRGHLEMIRLLLDNGVDANTSNTRGWTPINSAVSENHLEVVRLLLDKGVDANTSSTEGWAPINSAAQIGDLEVVRLLLENGVDANTSNDEGWTPINSAAQKGHLEVVRLLLENGVDANTANNREWTPINSAAQQGHLEVVRLLLDNGADANTSSKLGWTPINSAARNAHLEVVRLLLDRGADATIATRSRVTPFHSAVSSGNIELAKLLFTFTTYPLLSSETVECNPQKQAMIKEPTSRIDSTLQSVLDDNATYGPCLPAPHRAAAKGHLSMLQALVEVYKTDINVKDRMGRTPLHMAAQSGNIHCVDYLLSLDQGLRCSDIDMAGNSTTYYACSSGSLGVTRRVMELDPIEMPDANKWSLLHWACRSGDPGLVEFLIENGVHETLVDTAQPLASWSPMSIALFHKNSKFESATGPLLSGLLRTPMLSSVTQSDSTSMSVMAAKGGQHGYFSCDSCLHVSLIKNQTTVLIKEQDIYGPRFTCTVCSDFDFCFMCNAIAEKMHPEHSLEMIEYSEG